MQDTEQKLRGSLRFTKKPVTIEAVQWDGTKSGIAAIEVAFPGIETCTLSSNLHREEVTHWRIRTLEDGHVVSPGDWIIKGVKGEFYPCKPDIFAATYDPAALSLPTQAEPVAQLIPMTESERTDMACAVAQISTGCSVRNVAALAIEWTEQRYGISSKEQTTPQPAPARTELQPMSDDESTLMLADKIGFGDGALQTVNRSDLVSIIRAVEAHRGIQAQAVPQGWNKSVADAEIKALYVESQGSDKGWLGIEGSYFIGGVVAARKQKAAPAQAREVGLMDEQTLKDAYQEGYYARVTYNDAEASDLETEWSKSSTKALVAALRAKGAV